MTKTEHNKVVEEMQRNNVLLSIAINDLCSGAVKWHRAGNYSIGLSRLTGASGGIVTVKWRCKGQSDTINTYWLNDFLEIYRGMELRDQDMIDLCHLHDVAQVERQRAIDAEVRK